MPAQPWTQLISCHWPKSPERAVQAFENVPDEHIHQSVELKPYNFPSSA